MDAEQSELMTWDGPLTVSDEHMVRITPPSFNSIAFVGDGSETILWAAVDGEADQKELAFFIRGERATSDEQIGAALREWAKTYLKFERENL